MRKEYDSPKFEIEELEKEDIVLVSGNNWNSTGEDGKPESGSADVFEIVL